MVCQDHALPSPVLYHCPNQSSRQLGYGQKRLLLVHPTRSGIKGAVVRTSTIPEELGRIEYLLSDKTGTLTQNEMEMKKIHIGTVSYANEAMDEVASYVRQGFSMPASHDINQLLYSLHHHPMPLLARPQEHAERLDHAFAMLSWH